MTFAYMDFFGSGNGECMVILRSLGGMTSGHTYKVYLSMVTIWIPITIKAVSSQVIALSQHNCLSPKMFYCSFPCLFWEISQLEGNNVSFGQLSSEHSMKALTLQCGSWSSIKLWSGHSIMYIKIQFFRAQLCVTSGHMVSFVSDSLRPHSNKL